MYLPYLPFSVLRLNEKKTIQKKKKNFHHFFSWTSKNTLYTFFSHFVNEQFIELMTASNPTSTFQFLFSPIRYVLSTQGMLYCHGSLSAWSLIHRWSCTNVHSVMSREMDTTDIIFFLSVRPKTLMFDVALICICLWKSPKTEHMVQHS